MANAIHRGKFIFLNSFIINNTKWKQVNTQPKKLEKKNSKTNRENIRMKLIKVKKRN